MADKTPGKIAYAAYHATWLRLAPRRVRPTWSQLTPEDQHAWEAAAEAVLALAQGAGARDAETGAEGHAPGARDAMPKG